MEAFFCPLRLLCGSFESFFNDFPERVQASGASQTSWYNVKGVLPLFYYAWHGASETAPGSLMDYLGYVVPKQSTRDEQPMNLLPLVCYHLIWQEWYRNPRVQNACFTKTLTSSVSQPHSYKKAALIPNMFFHTGFSEYADNHVFESTSGSLLLADGKYLTSLRQRNFGLDYFTGARVSPQQGEAAGVTLDTSGDSATVTIAALRAVNSLQQFRERNALCSPRFVDQVKSRYGVSPEDGVAQRPICIGSASYDLSTRGVDQTAVGGTTAQTSNPFTTVASQYGRGAASGSDFIIDNFTALEPGYIMVMMSLVPEVTYTYGIDPMFKRYLSEGSITDMANPLLQNVGDEPIYSEELSPSGGSANDWIFGYQDRYSKFMFKKNSVHGKMISGESLASFVLQRDLGQEVNLELSSSFLEIPTNYFDNVFALKSQVSGLSYWYDAYLDYKVTMPLAEFSVPSLQDPAYEHGKSVVIRRNGQIF